MLWVVRSSLQRSPWRWLTSSGSALHPKVLGCVSAHSRSYATDKVPKPDYFSHRQQADTTKNKGPVSWVNLAFVSSLLALMYAAYYYARREKEKMLLKERRKEIGKSKIGGTFDLIDHTGAPRKSSDFFGKWLLIYFGFTHCPDVCPDEMDKIAAVYENLKKERLTNNKIDDVVPLFITVDPERDKFQDVAEYIKEFHPDFVGLTGSPDSIKAACKAYRVYYSAAPRAENDDDYIVDHTIIIYLVDPEGQFVDYYGQNKSAHDITNSVIVQMAKYKMIK